MRRVLHLVGASEDNGGILSTIRGIAAHGPALGWSHLTWMRRGFQQLRSPRLEVVTSPFALGESPSHLRLLASAIGAWPGLRRLVQRERFDVVHGHSRGALLLSSWLARSGLPVVFTNHAYARRTGMYRKVASTPGLRTILLTPNQARHYGIAPREGAVDIVSECGADRYFEVPLREGPGMQDGKLRVVGVGNIVRWKRWDVLVEALARLPRPARDRVRATIWGPVPDEPDARDFARELAEKVASHGLQETIRFPGPTLDIGGVLAEADVFVLPSTNEPCSVALIEALATGVPAIVTSSGGNVDIVQDGVTGLLFSPGSAEDLSRRLMATLAGPWTLASRSEVRASVSDRRARDVAARHAAIYASMTRPPTSVP